MSAGSGIFSTLPPNFFSPLVRVNREHYAALLVLYFRLFQENSGRLERELVIRGFTDYVGLHRDSLAAETPELRSDDDRVADDQAFDDWPEGKAIGAEDRETPFLDFGDVALVPARDAEGEGAAGNGADDRALASRFLRRLIHTGWLGEETLADYTRVINITPHARPFFEALARVEEGLKTEYESHVVAIYSLLCGDAVQENGHYAVLNAHNATTALIDSLKVLSQSIKGHYDRFTEEAASVGISDLLHLHYDIYANDILDGAYKRLKTSDNLSRYRPRIIKKVGELLSDEPWLEDSSRKLSRLGSSAQAESRLRLCTMLEEIRDTLRAVDPLLDDIDRRNMLYARSSIERVKTLLEPDSTIAGKLGSLIREIYAPQHAGGEGEDERPPHLRLLHRLHGIRAFAPESLYRRHKRETVRLKRGALAVADREAQKRVEAELLLRLRRQLSPARISSWLDELGGRERALASGDLVRDEDSFGHFIYGILYADSRPRSFDYAIEENPGDPPVETGDYVVPDLVLRRKR
ncbi:MAG: DUF5716 family protein [Spirochaetaceae bacterium]|jgi:hypothetical protein|nr:DUF5716 family protein [Spirochaetaceae bacterium]